MIVSTLATLIVVAATKAIAESNAHQDWRKQVDAARERYDDFATRAVAFRDALAVRRRARPRELRLDDPTLRPGDIVVTPTSLLLFKGSQKYVFDEADFERVDEWRARRLPHSKDLRAILRRGISRGRRE